MKKIAPFFVVLLCLVSHVVHAQAVVSTAFAFERFMVSAKGAGWTTGGNALGQTVAMGPASLTKAYAAASAATVTPLSTGGASVAMTVGGGAAGVVAVASEAVVTGASVFGLFKAIMGGPVGLGLTALMLAPALLDWLAVAGVRLSPTVPGALEQSSAAGVMPALSIFGQSDVNACNGMSPGQGNGPRTGSCVATEVPGATCGYWVTLPTRCYALNQGPGWIWIYGTSTLVPVPSWQPATIEEIRTAMESIPVKKALIDALLQAAQDGPEPKPSLPLTSPKNTTVSPSSVSDGSVVTVTKADGKTTTKTETRTTTLTPSTGVDAQGRQVPTVTATTRVDTTVKVVDDATGAVLSESTTVAGTPTKPAEPAPEIETCGLPGKPKCLIDETGTPEKVEVDVYKPKLDDYKTKQGELKDTVSGSADKSFFSGWGAVFITPPMATCAPFALPRDMGSLDPCPVVEGMRSVMAYMWAIGAFWLSLGMIKKVI